MTLLGNKLSVKDTFLFVIFALLTSYIPFNTFGSLSCQIIGVLLCAIVLFSGISCVALQIVFFMPFLYVTAFPLFGANVHIITILEILFFLKVIRKYSLPRYFFYFIVFLLLWQLSIILIYGMPFTNVAKLVFNFLLFFCYFSVLKDSDSLLDLVYFVFGLGVFVSCIAGEYFIAPDTEEQFDLSISWMRYCGLWTDPNFFSFFCLLGILSLLRVRFKNHIISIARFIACVIIFRYGMISMSRTFLIALIVVLFFYLLSGFRSKHRFNFTSLLLVILGIVGINYYWFILSNNRVVDDAAFAGGRLALTKALLDGFLHDTSILLGAGFDNWEYLTSISVSEYASHNSYVDIFLQFGILGVALLIVYLIRNFQSFRQLLLSVLSRNGLPMLCVLIYLATLSALKYEFVYIFVALFVVEFRREKTIIN